MFKKISMLLLVVMFAVSSTGFAQGETHINDENYVSVNGDKIYYDNFGNTDSEKTVLIIHGAGGTAEAVRPLGMYLQNFNVVIIDLPGHNRSEGDLINSIDGYSKFIKNLIKQLRKNDVVTDDVTLIGHSMGGAITLNSAIQDNVNVVKRFVIVNSSYTFDYLPQELLDVLANGEMPMEFFAAGFTPYTPPELIQYFMDNITNLMCPVEVVYNDFLAVSEFSVEKDLKRVDKPTLILGAELDNAAPIEYSIKMNEYVENSILITYEKVGHLLPIEKAEQVGADITEFINNN